VGFKVEIRRFRNNLVERGLISGQAPGGVEFPDCRVDLSQMDDHKPEAVVARLLMSYAKKGGRPAIVGRRMQDGDMVLNRQVRDDIMTIHVLDTNPRMRHIVMHHSETVLVRL
jgi:hypothetical protein